MHPLQYIFFIYIAIGFNLFFSLGCIISTMINILGKRIHLLISDGDADLWGHCYGLIVQLISSVNKSFGLQLLWVLVFYFIWTVNGMFYILVGFRERGLLDKATLLVIALQIVVFLVLLIFLYIPHRIVSEVNQNIQLVLYSLYMIHIYISFKGPPFSRNTISVQATE